MAGRLEDWTTGAPGADASRPAAVALQDGSLLVAGTQTDAGSPVTVQRLQADGAPPGSPELTLAGYREPTLAGDGVTAWLVMVRDADGAVVSRRRDPISGWSATDTLELAPTPDGGPRWPNALRSTAAPQELDGRARLRVVARGAQNPQSAQQSAVLGLQRVAD